MFRHCGACGSALAATPCGACGFATPLPFLFCGNCGTGLELTGAGQAEERKLATVLFADVVGFTSMAEATDPEVMARAVDAAFRQLTDIVVAYGGTIDKYIGDSMMAVFGVPHTHEDDAERAVAAALAIQAAETGLEFSIGVNTGEVMVLALGGGAVTVMGDAVNVAARLEKAASRHEILAGPLTVELTSNRIEYRDRPPMTLKGKRDSVEVRQAMSMRTTPTVAQHVSVPIIGRDEELDFLLSQWRRVASVRRGAVVLVTGDPGIGKSRLLDELAERVGGEAHIVRSAYPPYGGSGGIRVGGDLVAQLGPSDDDAVQARALSLTGEVHPSLRDMDANALRQEGLWALRRLAELRAAERPVLVLIEDAHVASASLDLLTSFVARTVDLPVLLVFAGRAEGQWLSSFPTASTVRLSPLSMDDAAVLAAAWRPSPEPSEQVLRMSAGNPLFLRELLVLSAQMTGDEFKRRRLPASLRAVLAARLDSLAIGGRGALQDLAVIGDAATVEQLTALGGAAAADGVSSLTRIGLVQHRPDGTLRITEPLLREVAYATLPRAARAERHVRAAELCAGLPERARHLERASEHAPDDAALRDRAGAALATAGVHQLRDSRPIDGIALLQRAVALGHRDPDALLRLAAALIDRDRHEAMAVLDLIPDPHPDSRVDAERTLVRANALVESDHPAALRAFDDAAQRWRSIGDRVKEAWSHSNKGVALFMRGAMFDADEQLVTALDLFRSERHRAGEMATVSFRALVRPEHPEVENWLHESLAYAVEIGDRGRHVAALGSLSWHHYLRTRLGGDDQTQQARAWIDECSALSSELGGSDFGFQVLCLKANLARMAGRLDDARDALDRARGFGTSDSAGERAMLQAVGASIEGSAPFVRYNEQDPFTSIAAVIQMETALLEGRFDELLLIDAMPSRSNLGRHEALVGSVPLAAGLAVIGRLHEAEEGAARALISAERSNASLPAAGARAVAAECAFRLGDSARGKVLLDAAVGSIRASNGERPVTPIGGLAGALVARAGAAGGGDDAWLSLRGYADRLRAPGLLEGLVPA